MSRWFNPNRILWACGPLCDQNMFDKNKQYDYELSDAKKNIDPRAVRLDCGGIAIPDPANDFTMFCTTCFTVCGSVSCPCSKDKGSTR